MTSWILVFWGVGRSTSVDIGFVNVPFTSVYAHIPVVHQPMMRLEASCVVLHVAVLRFDKYHTFNCMIGWNKRPFPGMILPDNALSKQ